MTIKTSNFESVNEADADEKTCVVFEDIKSTMGVALVNQVWRRFAVIPAVLEVSWQTLKPYYQDGAIIDEAWKLRQELKLLSLGPIISPESENLKSELKDAAVIDDVLRTYERGNAQNLIALCLLQEALESLVPESLVNRGEDRVFGDHERSNLRLDAIQTAEQTSDAVFADIPNLPRLDALPEDMQALVARASLTWVPSKYVGLQPSVFRHLSYWPDLLLLFADRLEQNETGSVDSIDQLASRALVAAKATAREQSVPNDSLMRLSNAERLWLQQELQVFIEVMLARGVVIVPSLRSLLR